jgi:transcription elongation factor GreB
MKDETNPITPVGFKRLQDELHQLRYKERPEIVKVVAWAASNGDRSENGDYLYGKKKLREIDRRCEFLAGRIHAAEVIDPALSTSTRVEFGATVTILNENDQEKVYCLVGVDEIDVEKGRVSWKSPLAKALLNKRVGDTAVIKKPAGEEEVEIIELRYTTISD